MVPLIGGLLFMGIPYLIDLALYISLAVVALIAGIYFLKKLSDLPDYFVSAKFRVPLPEL